jgi:hypothetical protein
MTGITPPNNKPEGNHGLSQKLKFWESPAYFKIGQERARTSLPRGLKRQRPEVSYRPFAIITGQLHAKIYGYPARLRGFPG